MIRSDFTRVFLLASNWRLEVGMVFHIYTSAVGIGMSETVVTTQDGCERLTRLERMLLVKPRSKAS